MPSMVLVVHQSTPPHHTGSCGAHAAAHTRTGCEGGMPPPLQAEAGAPAAATDAPWREAPTCARAKELEGGVAFGGGGGGAADTGEWCKHASTRACEFQPHLLHAVQACGG